MSHPTMPTEVRPCRSGHHPDHVVMFVSDTIVVCTPPCEAAQYRHECRHVRDAMTLRARLMEREVRRRARTGGTWLDEIDFGGIERSYEERIADERAAIERGYE